MQPYQQLFNTIQEIDAAGKVKLSADERAIIERETRDLINKSQMKNYKFASSVPQGFEMLLNELKGADAEEAYRLVKDFMEKEDEPEEKHEDKMEEKEEGIIKDLDKGVEDLKDVEEEEAVMEIKEEVEEKKEEKKEKKEEKKEDKPEKKDDKPEYKKDDKPDFLKDKEKVMAQLKDKKAQEMMEKKPMDKKPGLGDEMPMDKGKGPLMDGKGPHGPGKMKDMKDKKDIEKDKKPSMDEMGIEDKEIDPTISLRAQKTKVKITAERNIIAYHEDHGPVFLIIPSDETKANKLAMRRLANRAFGISVSEGFAVAAKKLGGQLVKKAGVDDDVEVVTREEPETPETMGVTEEAESVAEEMPEEKDVGDDVQAEADDDMQQEKPKVARYKVVGDRKRAWDEDYDDEDFDEYSVDAMLESWINGNRSYVVDLLKGKGDYALISEFSSQLDPEEQPILQRMLRSAKAKNAADGDVTNHADNVTEEKPASAPSEVTNEDDDVAQQSKETPADNTLVDGDVDFKTAQRKIEATYKKRYAAKLKKAQEDFVKKFTRCMRIASKRMLLNYDENPWKTASDDVLTSDDIEFEDGSYLKPMREHIAVQLTELIAQESHEDFVAHLMDRTADLMDYSSDYLEDAEKDLGALQPKAREATVEKPRQPKTAKATQVRRAASNGNFGLTNKAASARPAKQPGVREALYGGTKVDRDLGNLKR